MRRLLAVGSAVVALTLSASALAQPGGGRGGPGGFMDRAFETSLTTREMDQIASMLDMSADQKEVTQVLLQGFLDEFTAKVSDMRAAMDDIRTEARENQDFSGFQRMGDLMQEFREETQRMEASFMDDVRAVLTPDQLERWPAVERHHRRVSSVGRGMMSGERVDLIEIIDGMDLGADAKADVADVLARYEEELDRALIARNTKYDAMSGAFRAMFQGGPDEDQVKQLEDARKASMRVRDTSERFARQITPLLPEDARGVFEQKVLESAYPQVYRPTRASRAFELAVGMSDLSPQQKEDLSMLRVMYTRDLSGINDKLVKATREREENFDPASMGRGGFGRGQDDPTRELFGERRDLDQGMVSRIEGVLTDEQADKIREAMRAADEQNRQQRGGFGGGRGPGGAGQPQRARNPGRA